jgi:predicted DNA-binding transcriptional regulator YafY
MSRGDPLIRQWNLLTTLQNHRFGLDIKDLVTQMGCSKRQVQRDLNLLQKVGFPVSFEQRDFGKRFWKLTPHYLDGQREPLALSVTEMLSLFLSRQVLSPLVGTQFGDGLATALDKIKALMPAKALLHFDGLDDNLLVKSIARHDYSGQDKQIQIINQAMADGRVLRIRYRSASQARTLDTRFHPYGLVFFGMSLYCIGHLEEYDEVRTLKVVRLAGVEMTADRFQRPATFSLKAYTHGGFGIIHGSRFQEIKVKFTDWAATNVREHTWHSSQKIIKDTQAGDSGAPRRTQGHVVATFELSDTTEFKRWLLGFGRHARVLSPKPFAQEMKGEFRAVCGTYGVRCRAQQ